MMLKIHGRKLRAICEAHNAGESDERARNVVASIAKIAAVDGNVDVLALAREALAAYAAGNRATPEDGTPGAFDQLADELCDAIGE